MGMAEGTTPGRPRNTEADEAILEAAADLLIESGIDGAGIDRVAKRAGVSRPTVYRRYSDKTELLIAAIHWCFRTQPEELPEPRDIEQMLSWWAYALYAPENARIRKMTLRLAGSRNDHPEFAEVFAKRSSEPRKALVARVLRREQARGRFPADTDLEIVQDILSGAVVVHLTGHPEGSTVQEAENYYLAVLRETRFRREGRAPQRPS